MGLLKRGYRFVAASCTQGFRVAPQHFTDAVISVRISDHRSPSMRVVIYLTLLAAASAEPTCCFSKWGDASSCGNYHGHGGLCNTDPTKKCSASSACPAKPPPTPPAPPASGWPASVQPFFLSALPTVLTPDQAQYIGRFPLAVINHKQGSRELPRNAGAEAKQLEALAAIKAANASCQTFFYLNSQIDFPELQMHQAFAANGTWWLKDNEGHFVWHSKGSHVMDLTVPEARVQWIHTAIQAISNASIDGIFVDKAKSGSPLKGLSKARIAAWEEGHQAMITALGEATKKVIILNNADKRGHRKMGQLFERWGANPDHDDLSLQADVRALQRASSTPGVISLARAGGVQPGSNTTSDPVACGASLAAYLIAIATPNSAFFSCEPDFSSRVDPQPQGWMTLLEEPIYGRQLGAPLGAATVVRGFLKRNFQGGAVAWLKTSAAGLGCVQWRSGVDAGEVYGRCPPGVPPLQNP